MTHDPLPLVATLHELQATMLDEAFLTRLEAAADETLIQLSREEVAFEASLRGIIPAGLTPDIMARMEKVVHDIPFTVDEKIVLFPKANQSPTTRRSRPGWAAAAAVALIGGLTALLIPSPKSSENIARQLPTSASPPTQTSSGNFVSASFNRGISEVRNEGILWKSDKQPHNVIQMVYKDIITLKDKNGRTFQVEQPRVEYILLPANTD